MEWNLADAKNRFSELINLVLTKGPQRVHRRKDTVVVITAKEYEKLRGKRTTFKDYLMKGESLQGVKLSRDTSLSRDIKI